MRFLNMMSTLIKSKEKNKTNKSKTKKPNKYINSFSNQYTQHDKAALNHTLKQLKFLLPYWLFEYF